MKWLQISDLHFGYEGYDTEILRHNLIGFLRKYGHIDFILISGDCMYCNFEDKCDEFVLELGQACNCSRENIFITPGNHDICLENRDLVPFEFDRDKRQYEALASLGYEKFKDLYKRITGKEYLPYQVMERHIGREKFRIIAVDSCLFLGGRTSRYNLSMVWFELEKLVGQIRNDEYINILTMHHGLEYFEPNSRNQFKKWIENNYIDIIFCGHSVIDEVNTYISTQKQIQQFISGMVPLGENITPNFWICQFEADTAIVEMNLYTYDHKGMLFKSCLWNGDSYHYQIFRKRDNATDFLKKSEEVIKSKKGNLNSEKLLYKEMNAFYKAIRNILNEPYDIHNSSARHVSPDGILCYNRLANKFNRIFPETDMFIFREDTTPNLVTHPKTQEILYQLEYALDIIIDDLNQKKEVIDYEHGKKLKKKITNSEFSNKKVFVVHGHDEGAKQTVARFLEQCDFEDVILNEQADNGKTIIEKIEQYT